jgi:hypothetical protein
MLDAGAADRFDSSHTGYVTPHDLDSTLRSRRSRSMRLPFKAAAEPAAGVEKLCDHTYAEHLNLAGSADFGYPAEPVRIHEPGRNLWLKLDLSF